MNSRIRNALAWMEERARNSTSFGSHCHAYEVAASHLKLALDADDITIGRASRSEMVSLVAAIIQDEAKYDPTSNTWDVEKAADSIVTAFETA